MKAVGALQNVREELYRERVALLARLYKCERLIEELDAAIEAAKKEAT